MADTLSPAARSAVMAKVRSKHTAPEMAVRRLAHAMGYRFRLHVRSLPGTPDLVFPRLRAVIEVRGCFWHMHECGACRIPGTRRAWWKRKLEGNARRDRLALGRLRRLGWRVMVVWECQTRDPERLRGRVGRFLGRKL